jgi:hypothetical protein
MFTNYWFLGEKQEILKHFLTYGVAMTDKKNQVKMQMFTCASQSFNKI